MNPREGSLAYRDLGNGRELVVYPLTYGRARLVIGGLKVGYYDDGW